MVVPVPEFITGESIMQRFERVHQPEGFNLGPFQVNTRLDLALGYDTNIYDAHNRKQDDGYATTGAGFAAHSSRDDRYLSVDGEVFRTTYFTQSSNDAWSGRVLADGWKDLGSSLRIRGNAMVAREIERRDDPQSSPATEPVLYWHYRAGTTLESRNAIFTFSGGVLFDRVDYDDVASTIGKIDLSERNLNEIDAIGRATYNLASDRIFYIEGIGNTRLPDDRYDSNGLRRESNGFSLSLGTDYALTALWRFAAEVGFLHQDYLDSDIENVNGPRGNVQLIWSPTLMTEIAAQFAHQYYESFDVTSPGYWLDSAAITVTQEITRDLVVVGQASTGYRNFVDDSRYEHVYTLNAGLHWNAAAGMVVGLDNSFERQTAQDSSGRFNSNITVLRVTKTF